MNERQILVEPRTNCKRRFVYGKPFYSCYQIAYQKSKNIQASEDREIRCIFPDNPRRSIFYDILLKRNQSPGGCTTYISGTGTCHREGYLFSRYWYKERYHFSQFWYKKRYLFSRFLYEIYKVGYTISKNCIRNGYVFEVSMARPRPKSGQVHPPGPKLVNFTNFY